MLKCFQNYKLKGILEMTSEKFTYSDFVDVHSVLELRSYFLFTHIFAKFYLFLYFLNVAQL